uniref:Uncharacterized protein n=1 Tax=Anguilla anguilla TaxID=7936 RepID=A0A0E9Q7B3_ANGAN
MVKIRDEGINYSFDMCLLNLFFSQRLCMCNCVFGTWLYLLI